MKFFKYFWDELFWKVHQVRLLIPQLPFSPLQPHHSHCRQTLNICSSVFRSLHSSSLLLPTDPKWVQLGPNSSLINSKDHDIAFFVQHARSTLCLSFLFCTLHLVFSFCPRASDLLSSDLHIFSLIGRKLYHIISREFFWCCLLNPISPLS